MQVADRRKAARQWWCRKMWFSYVNLQVANATVSQLFYKVKVRRCGTPAPIRFVKLCTSLAETWLWKILFIVCQEHFIHERVSRLPVFSISLDSPHSFAKAIRRMSPWLTRFIVEQVRDRSGSAVFLIIKMTFPRDLFTRTPPQEITSNFIDPESLASLILDLSVIIIVLSTIFVLIRLYSNYNATRGLGWDDLFCVVATILLFTYIATCISGKYLTF